MPRQDRPIKLFSRPGLFGSIGKYIPAPIKAFGAVATLAAATVILAPAVIILAGPPLLVGAFLWRRQLRKLQSMADQLHDQRWKDLASFHLQKGPIKSASSNFQTGRIPMAAQIAIDQAISRNEQQLATILGVSDPTEISYGQLAALYQDFNLDPSGFNEKMSISEFPIRVKGHTIGKVRVISREQEDIKKTRLRIEIEARRRVIVLKPGGEDENVIQGGGRAIY